MLIKSSLFNTHFCCFITGVVMDNEQIFECLNSSVHIEERWQKLNELFWQCLSFQLAIKINELTQSYVTF